MWYMIDLETLSTRPDAAILQIGIVAFDLYGIKDSKQWNVEAEGRVDRPTLHWWKEQIAAGVDPPGLGPMPLKLALEDIVVMMKPDEAMQVWANPSTFDIVILGEAFHRCGMSPPWNHRQVRDLRTLRMLYPDVPRPKPDLPHVAVYDAMAQATWVMRMFECHEISVTRPAD
jgi:exodeoxyribonuclease VIII